MKLSAIILTKNEQENIGKCLDSLEFCDEIIVIDDYSTDDTVKLARDHGAAVYKHRLNNNFADQRSISPP